MNVDRLDPLPSNCEQFARRNSKFVPESSGCYVLTTVNGTVVYVGLAENLRRRMGQHLDNPEKTQGTTLGRATNFYWLATKDIGRVERTWLNIHIHHEAEMPLLNKIFSPI